MSYRNKGFKGGSRYRNYGKRNWSGTSESGGTIRAHYQKSQGGRTTKPGNDPYTQMLKENQKMKFCCTKAMGMTGVPSVYCQFRPNSIWDPDATIGTGQTTADGWTEMNNLYNKYMIKCAKIKVHFTLAMANPVESGLLNNQMMVSLKLRDDTVSVDTADNIMLNGNAVWKVFQPPPVGTFECTLEGWYNPSRLFGPEADPKSALWDDYGSLFTDNPDRVCMWNIGLRTTDGGNTTAPILAYARVEITYYPIFNEVKELAMLPNTDAQGMIEKGKQLVAAAKANIAARLKREGKCPDGKDSADTEDPTLQDYEDTPQVGMAVDDSEALLDSETDTEPQSQVEETVATLMQQVKQLTKKTAAKK